jgi:hypothetical protein
MLPNGSTWNVLSVINTWLKITAYSQILWFKEEKIFVKVDFVFYVICSIYNACDTVKSEFYAF